MNEIAPQVYKSATPLPVQAPWKKKMPMIFLLILVIIIAGEAWWGFQTIYGQKAVLNSDTEQITNLSEAQIVALPSKSTYQIGEMVPLTIKVVTGGKSTDSTDIVLKYDSPFLETSGSGFVEIGRIYPDYPVANFDNTKGIAQVSGASLSSESGFSGIGTFAVINFKAKAAGKTVIQVEHQPGSTSDSNIVLSGTAKDILSQVTNANIFIDTNSSVTSAAADPVSCSGYYQYCQVGEKTGKQFCQKGVLTSNQCSFDPALTVSCSECLIQ